MTEETRDCCGEPINAYHAVDCPLRLTPPRTFVLRRTVDVNGVSGLGDVAWGVEFPDGKIATRWAVTDVRQTCVWDSLADVLAIHGHDGATQIVWVGYVRPDSWPGAAWRLQVDRVLDDELHPDARYVMYRETIEPEAAS